MTQSAVGSLVMVGLNTSTPSLFWRGLPLQNITNIRVDWEEDDIKIKIKAASMPQIIVQELAAAGVTVKLGN